MKSTWQEPLHFAALQACCHNDAHGPIVSEKDQPPASGRHQVWAEETIFGGSGAFSTALLSQKVPVKTLGAMEVPEGSEERPETAVDGLDGKHDHGGRGRYAGQWHSGLMHGSGILTYSNGQRHSGFFFEGRPHGYGCRLSRGGTYDGQWKAGRAHGYGRYCYADGSTFEGEWREDEKTGWGIESYPDGAEYSGEFLNGGKHGSGCYRASSQAYYEGQFKDDRMEGSGRYRFADGRAYSGQWKTGRMHGIGTMTWPNGSRYEGGYEYDTKHGDGTFAWPDGQVYHGRWRAGQLHGSGVLVDPNGVESPREWRHGDELNAKAWHRRIRRALTGSRRPRAARQAAGTSAGAGSRGRPHSR